MQPVVMAANRYGGEGGRCCNLSRFLHDCLSGWVTAW